MATMQGNIPQNIHEEKLLRTIYSSQLSNTDRSHLLQLGEKLTAETINEVERAELGTLTDESERLNAERITAVSALATLRHNSLREMMQQLGMWRTSATSN